MPLTLPQIRENCRLARELYERSDKEKFAIGAFNVDNQETLIAICRAAQKLKSPVMVEVSHGEVEAIGLYNIRDMVDNYKRQYGIEMYINLDHSPTIEAAVAGVDAGFEFIHLDISQANHEAGEQEIIEATKYIVAYSRYTGALVESEPHYFGGSSNKHDEKFDYEVIKKTFSTPEDSRHFCEATGIDTFAAAVGNLHGSYPVPKMLDLDLLREIREAVTCHISLHGGSGTPLHYFESAAKIGVSKININSDMRIAFRNELEKVLKDNPKEFAVVKLMPQVYDAVQKVVEEKIQAFGSAGKARAAC